MGWGLTKPTRREVVFGVAGTGVAGAHHSETLTGALSGTYYDWNGWDFAISDASTSSGEFEPGNRATVYAKIENTGNRSGTVSSWLGIERPDGTRLYPDSTKTYDIGPGDSVIEEYSWLMPSDAPTGEYSFTIDLYDANENHMFDTTGFDGPLGLGADFRVSEILSELFDAASTIQWARIKGAVYGEFGMDMEVEYSETIPYYLGWLEASIVPVLDMFADIRDCAALDDWGGNVIDCSGAVLSTIGSLGTIGGVAGTIIPEPISSGAGIGILGTSLSIDTVEDIGDIARITQQFLRKADHLVGKVSSLLTTKFPDDQIRMVLSKMDDGVVKKNLAENLGVKERYAPTALADEAKLTVGKYREHIADQADHLTPDQIRETVEHADRVYKGPLKEADGINYWWVRRFENGDIALVKGTDLDTIEKPTSGDGLQINNALFNSKFDSLGDVQDQAKKMRKEAIHMR